MLAHSWGLSDKVDIRKTTLQPQSYLAHHVVGPHQGSWKCVQASMQEGPGSGQEAEYASLVDIAEWRRRRRRKTSWSIAWTPCSWISPGSVTDSDRQNMQLWNVTTYIYWSTILKDEFEALLFLLHATSIPLQFSKCCTFYSTISIWQLSLLINFQISILHIKHMMSS